MRLLLFTMSLLAAVASADECELKDVIRLQEIIAEGRLKSQGNDGKLLKFSQHDYPKWCKIVIESVEYKMYTSKGSPYFFYELNDGKQEKYYGLYKFKD